MVKETKFCVDNRVRVLTDRGNDCLFQGTIGTIQKVSDSIAGLNLLVESYSGCTYWYGADELELVSTSYTHNPRQHATHKVTCDNGVVYNILFEPCTDLV